MVISLSFAFYVHSHLNLYFYSLCSYKMTVDDLFPPVTPAVVISVTGVSMFLWSIMCAVDGELTSVSPAS